MPTVLEAAGGEAGLLRLARAWHERVVADEVVGHAFRHGFHPQHTERLAAYWVEALGGPPRFTGTYGDESAVVRMHSGNGEHEDMDDGEHPAGSTGADASGSAGRPAPRRAPRDARPRRGGKK